MLGHGHIVKDMCHSPKSPSLFSKQRRTSPISFEFYKDLLISCWEGKFGERNEDRVRPLGSYYWRPGERRRESGCQGEMRGWILQMLRG